MNSIWRRKRMPDDVPTPIAVAVADFCRRAKMPSSPIEVREALSALSDDEDFRAKSVADEEPPSSPLGPFAAVDLAMGAPAELAATRQACGYYDLVRDLLRSDPGSQSAPAPAHRAAESGGREIERTRRAAPVSSSPAPKRAETVAERISPKKRLAQPTGDVEHEAELPPDSFKRELPKPKGRFTKVAAGKVHAEELFKPDVRDYLARLAEQKGHRIGMLRTLSGEYRGRAGSELSFEDLSEVLKQQRLIEDVQRTERDLIQQSYEEHRGASGRVAWALGMTIGELDQLVRAVGLESEVAKVREQFRREALAPGQLASRLNLLGRTKYLDDLGISEKFQTSLRKELRRALEHSTANAATVDAVVSEASRRLGIREELLSRAAGRLGLLTELQKLL
jgi:hypothetical protein